MILPSIYLDSQDFSRLSHSNKSKSEADFEKYLLEISSSGRMEFRYSIIHVSEICHTDIDAVKFSSERARLLNALACGRCMRQWNVLLEDEIRHHFDNAYEVVATNDDNRWVEFSFERLDDFKAQLHEKVKAGLLQGRVSRRLRRRAMAKFDFIDELTSTPSGQRRLDEMVCELNEKFPFLSPLTRPMLADYIDGRNVDAFKEFMKGMICDPYNLIANLAPEFDKTRRVPSLIRLETR